MQTAFFVKHTARARNIFQQKNDQKGKSSFSSDAAKSTGAAGAAFIGGKGASIGGIC